MQTLDYHKEVTIRDMALKLALSPATVCRALKNDQLVSKHTRKRVFELAQRLGYRANDHARMLRTGRTHTIGCIVPRLNDPSIAAIVSGMEQAARREEFHLILVQSLGDNEIEAEAVRRLFDKGVDGLIVAPPPHTTQDQLEHFEPFIQKNVPVVLLDHPGNERDYMNIVVDHYRAGIEMTRHLLSLGRRRILHITSCSPGPAFAAVCEGFQQALAGAGLPLREKNILQTDLTWEAGLRTAEWIGRWEELPDAIFAANDACAAGCMTGLLQQGISVPDRIAVTGYGNDPISTATTPALTTIRYPGEQMGELALVQLIHRLQQGTTHSNPVVSILLRGLLLVRDSTLSMEGSGQNPKH